MVSARERSLRSFDPQIKPVLASMTLDEELGQMTQAELNNLEDERDIERLFLGSVLSGGDADPKEGNGLVAWTDTVDRLISISQKTRLRLPILYGVDGVHGHNNVLGATAVRESLVLLKNENGAADRYACEAHPPRRAGRRRPRHAVWRLDCEVAG